MRWGLIPLRMNASVMHGCTYLHSWLQRLFISLHFLLQALSQCFLQSRRHREDASEGRQQNHASPTVAVGTQGHHTSPTMAVGTQGLTFCSCDCWANASWIFSLNSSFSVSRTSRSLWCYKERHLRYCYGSDQHLAGTETICTQVTRAGKPRFILEILLLSSSARNTAQALAYQWHHTDQSIGTWNAAHLEKALPTTLGTTSLTDSFHG